MKIINKIKSFFKETKELVESDLNEFKLIKKEVKNFTLVKDQYSIKVFGNPKTKGKDFIGVECHEFNYHKINGKEYLGNSYNMSKAIHNNVIYPSKTKIAKMKELAKTMLDGW